MNVVEPGMMIETPTPGTPDGSRGVDSSPEVG